MIEDVVQLVLDLGPVPDEARVSIAMHNSWLGRQFAAVLDDPKRLREWERKYPFADRRFLAHAVERLGGRLR